MEGKELSHGRETWTRIYKAHYRLDSLLFAVTFSIREKQGAFLTVAPAEDKKKNRAGRGEGNHFFVVRILKKVVRK